MIATYRPVEAVLSGHPLRAVKQDLQARGLCHELPVGLLSEAAAAEYLAARLPGEGLPDGLAAVLHQRTEGHPLFLVSLVDDWLAQGVLAKRAGGWELKTNLEALAGGVPASVRALIEKQIERLGRDELRVLEGASVAGIEFAAAAAAAALEEDVVGRRRCARRSPAGTTSCSRRGRPNGRMGPYRPDTCSATSCTTGSSPSGCPTPGGGCCTSGSASGWRPPTASTPARRPPNWPFTLNRGGTPAEPCDTWTWRPTGRPGTTPTGRRSTTCAGRWPWSIASRTKSASRWSCACK